nr:hypothetical protein [uncultured bacterium]
MIRQLPLSEDAVITHVSARSADLPTVPIPTHLDVHFCPYVLLSLLRPSIAV